MKEEYKALYGKSETKEEALTRLCNVMEILRKECPWDKVQTHESLERDMIEEAYEAVNAIRKNDVENLREELGDVLLQVVFHSLIAEEDEQFELKDVIDAESDKMIGRHPHIFSTENAKTIDKVLEKWENIKSREHGELSFTDRLKNVPEALPALMRSEKVQRRAAKAGFDWNSAEGAFDKLEEEMEELKEACISGVQSHIEEEFGDMLFSMVNVSRFLNVDPEKSLNGCTEKFIRRFEYMEEAATLQHHSLNSMSLEEMEALWVEAKNNLRNK